jgi:hypothetical protein
VVARQWQRPVTGSPPDRRRTIRLGPKSPLRGPRVPLRRREMSLRGPGVRLRGPGAEPALRTSRMARPSLLALTSLPALPVTAGPPIRPCLRERLRRHLRERLRRRLRERGPRPRQRWAVGGRCGETPTPHRSLARRLHNHPPRRLRNHPVRRRGPPRRPAGRGRPGRTQRRPTHPHRQVPPVARRSGRPVSLPVRRQRTAGPRLA